MTIKFTEFTDGDWDAFSGAEKPEDSEPLMAEIKVDTDNTVYDALCIVDASGISIEVLDEEGSFIGIGYMLDIKPFKTAVFMANKHLLGKMTHRYIIGQGFSQY